jgi:hypothetical protein
MTFPGQPGRRHSTLESARRQPENQPPRSDVTAQTTATLTVRALSRVLALVVPRGVNAALVETLGFIGVSALLQVALLIRGLRLDAVVGLAL